MKTPFDLFTFFVGPWSLVRDFGSYGAASGEARFTLLTPTSLAYREDLKVNIPGFSEDVYKDYIYALEEGYLCKKFTDDRLFYRLHIENNTAIGTHLCRHDQYRACYTFLNENTFILTYIVNGPRKDYELRTKFQRCIQL